MDPKAAAKSKRSHTVHGRRTHQTPAAAAAHKHKRAAAASSSAPRTRNLPSNWDRYEEEPEAADGPAGWTGEVAPRSKGADFAFLLEQARAQPRDARGAGAASLLASPFDFMQASTFMLEAKGEGILSWCEDDNYILDDDLAPDFEVPFLSMDLLSLATQLSKLKLSQRLFIEEDLLPEDLATASEDNQTPTQHDTSLESDGKDTLVEDNFKEVEPRKKAISHDNTSNIHFDDQMKTGTVPSPGYSVDSKLEVVAAEEELDMLLDSLSGIHLPSSNFDDSYGNNSTLDGMKISESNEKATSSTSKSLELAPLDDALDVLLSETSLSVQNDGFAVSSSSCRPTFDSDDNIDFRYAKQIDVTTSIDDSVDNFLADTSLCLNDQKETTSELGQPNISNVSVPSHSGPSNVSADFDSWFDSL